MAHVSLYRAYRSQTFDELVGQEHVVRALTSALEGDSLHHAYLFTGPRGTGKTSLARILAKAVNCEQGPTPTPCNTCTACVAITDGSHIDVVEIDAASHGGVDDVRELRERIAFAPAAARRKIYIVDECHMLSVAGWNAFLKTIEEPPPHVLFVFATTEPHKVLDTILSRTQRFDLRRIGSDALGEHVRAICAAEGVEIEPDALEVVLRAGDGSARDTLSVLEQLIAAIGRTITADGVAEVLGATPGDVLDELARAIAAGDVASLMALVQRTVDSGGDPRQLARDAVEHLRRLFLIRTAPDGRIVEATPERRAALGAAAATFGPIQLLRAVDLLAECQAQMRRGSTRLPLEIALAKAALPESSGDPAAIAARLDRLESAPPSASAPTPAATAVAPASSPPAATEPPDPEPAASRSTPAAVEPSAPPPAAASSTDPDSSGKEAVAAPEATAPVASGEAPAPATPTPPERPAAPPASMSPADPPAGASAAPPAADPAASAAPPSTDPAASAGAATASHPASPTATSAPEPSGEDLAGIAARWPGVLDLVKARRKTTYALLVDAEPVSLDGSTLTLRFAHSFHAESCCSGVHGDAVTAAIQEVIGAELRVQGIVGQGGGSAQDVAPDPEADRTARWEAEHAAVAEAHAAEIDGTAPDQAESRRRAIDALREGMGAEVLDEG